MEAITGDERVDRALAPVLARANIAEDRAEIVTVDDTQWLVLTGQGLEAAGGRPIRIVAVMEVLRTALAAGRQVLQPGSDLSWIVRSDGELGIVFVRSPTRPDMAEVYVGWPVYIVQEEPCETCTT